MCSKLDLTRLWQDRSKYFATRTRAYERVTVPLSFVTLTIEDASSTSQLNAHEWACLWIWERCLELCAIYAAQTHSHSVSLAFQSILSTTHDDTGTLHASPMAQTIRTTELGIFFSVDELIILQHP